MASTGFLLVWSVVFERCPTSRLLGLTLEELRTLGVQDDFFVTCPKLVLSFVVVKVGGGYKNEGKNSLLLPGVLCMVLVETSFGYFFLERVYEADRHIHLAGSHLPGGMLAYVRHGAHNHGVACSARAPCHPPDDRSLGLESRTCFQMLPGETEAEKRTVLNARRSAACDALDAWRRGAAPEAVQGLRRMDAIDERAHGDKETLRRWADFSGIQYTLIPDLRDAYDALVASIRIEGGRTNMQLLARVSLPTLSMHAGTLSLALARTNDDGDGATQVRGDEDGDDALTQTGGDDLGLTAIEGPRRSERFSK